MRKKQPVAPPTREDQIARALAQFYSTFAPSPDLIAAPTRTFQVGQAVHFGNLDNCIVREVREGGKALLIEHTVLATRENPNPTATGFQVAWWFNVWPVRESPSDAPVFSRRQWRGQQLQTTLSSIFHMYESGGFVCNPEYQRAYVWTDADREALLNSIFNHLPFGGFVFVRNHGCMHEGDDTSVTYRTLAGDTVSIPRRHNYTTEVIDGQQRLTTLIAFLTDQWAYRGYRFSDLSGTDKRTIMNAMVAYRMIEEEHADPAELLELFMGVNAGVPQSPEHLDAVRQRLAALRQTELRS